MFDIDNFHNSIFSLLDNVQAKHKLQSNSSYIELRLGFKVY